jgi:hypothetical protein
MLGCLLLSWTGAGAWGGTYIIHSGNVYPRLASEVFIDEVHGARTLR